MDRIHGEDNERETALLEQYTDATILDIGNGGTVYTLLDDSDSTVIPFDIERRGLERLHGHGGVPQSYAAHSVQGDAYHMPFAPDSIDVAFERGALLHLEGTGFRSWLKEDGDVIFSADTSLPSLDGAAAKARALHLTHEFDEMVVEQDYLCLNRYHGTVAVPDAVETREIDIPTACELLDDLDVFYEEGCERDPTDVPTAANYERRAIQQKPGWRLQLYLDQAEQPQTFGVRTIRADLVQRDDTLYVYTRNGITTADDDWDFSWDHRYDGVIEDARIDDYTG